MQCKNNKIVCIILAVIIFLSGMYFENKEVDSYFAHSSADKINSCIKSDNISIADSQVCTAELPSLRSSGGLQRLSGRSAYQKRDMKLPLDFLCFNSLSLQKGKFFVFSEITQSNNLCSEKHVINYIQNSDGKKQI